MAGRPSNPFRKVPISVTISPDKLDEANNYIGIDKRFMSMTELVEYGITLVILGEKYVGDTNGAIKEKVARPAQELSELIMQKSVEILRSTAGAQMAVQEKVEMDSRAVLAKEAAQQYAKPTPPTPTPVVVNGNGANNPSTPVPEKHETTATNNPEQRKQELADEIRRRYPRLLVQYINPQQPPQEKKSIENKILADLEALWRYTKQTNRDEFLSDCMENLMLFTESTTEYGDLKVRRKMMQDELRRMIMNDQKFASTHIAPADKNIPTLPSDISELIREGKV